MNSASWVLLLEVGLFGIGAVSDELPRPTISPNKPPHVWVTFPNADQSGIPDEEVIRLKAEAYDPDGSVEYVQFYVGTNLVGLSTSPPFSVQWIPPFLSDKWMWTTVMAVAVDDLGASSASQPVTIFVDGPAQPRPISELLSPRDGEVFPAPATFEFAIQLLASMHYPIDMPAPPGGPAGFFIGTNFVRATPERPYSITVTNLAPGSYVLRTINYELNNADPLPITIHVAQVGFRSASKTALGQMTCSAFNTLGDAATVVQASTDFKLWTPIATNGPGVHSFYFQDETTNQPRRFYRLVTQPP